MVVGRPAGPHTHACGVGGKAQAVDLPGLPSHPTTAAPPPPPAQLGARLLALASYLTALSLGFLEDNLQVIMLRLKLFGARSSSLPSVQPANVGFLSSLLL